MMILLFFGVVGAILVGLMVYAGHVIAADESQVLGRGSDRMRAILGRLRPDGERGPRLTWEVCGRRADLRLQVDPSGLTVTRAVVDLRGDSPGVFKLAPPGWASSVARVFGEQDLQIGDPRFDADYVIQANPKALAPRFFNFERKARAIAAVRRIAKHGLPFIDLTRQTLSIGVVRELRTDGELQDLAASARDFVEIILEIPADGGIRWLGDPGPAIGQCQVCGTEMRDRVVLCASCKTPHHEECWRYAGECSTYACGERSYVKDGARVRMPERRQTPREWLREEIARDRRQTGGFRPPPRAFPEVDEMLRRFERRQRGRGRR